MYSVDDLLFKKKIKFTTNLTFYSQTKQKYYRKTSFDKDKSLQVKKLNPNKWRHNFPITTRQEWRVEKQKPSKKKKKHTEDL